MNAEAQRIAIAEACGWFFSDRNWHMPNGAKATADGGPDLPPDYLNDLNAMHEAERALTEKQWDIYEERLRDACDGPAWYDGAGKEIIHATAEQRAEAFLRTIGRWTE